MGWKRIKKEIQRAGQSCESEGQRLNEKVKSEINRCKTTVALSIESEIKVNAALEAQLEENCSVGLKLASIATDKIIEINPEGLRPGWAFIINHLTFNDENLMKRTGSEHDLRRLQGIFQQFGMKVQVLQDATLTCVSNVMTKISSLDFENLSCLVLVIMSHGFEGNIIAAKDGKYSLDHDIMYPILQNRSLTSKLKLIVTQACKGPVNPLFEIEGPRRRPTAIPSEILQLNSCVEGYVSYLNTMLGSLFIMSFCDHLEQYGHEKNILDLANAIVADVKKKYSDIQIPMLHSNLTKEFVFGHYINNLDENTD